MPYSDPDAERRYHKEYHRRWYLKNREAKRAQNRASRAAKLEEDKQRQRRYDIAHAAEIKERKRLYYLANREHILGLTNKYNAENIEAKRARGRAYAKRKRDQYNTHKHTRRTREAKCIGSHTTAEWRALLVTFSHACLRCGRPEPEIKLTRDHVIPIALGGSSYIDNIQPLCGTCNRSKGARSSTDYRPASFVIVVNDIPTRICVPAGASA